MRQLESLEILIWRAGSGCVGVVHVWSVYVVFVGMRFRFKNGRRNDVTGRRDDVLFDDVEARDDRELYKRILIPRNHVRLLQI